MVTEHLFHNFQSGVETSESSEEISSSLSSITWKSRPFAIVLFSVRTILVLGTQPNSVFLQISFSADNIGTNLELQNLSSVKVNFVFCAEVLWQKKRRTYSFNWILRCFRVHVPHQTCSSFMFEEITSVTGRQICVSRLYDCSHPKRTPSIYHGGFEIAHSQKLDVFFHFYTCTRVCQHLWQTVMSAVERDPILLRLPFEISVWTQKYFCRLCGWTRFGKYVLRFRKKDISMRALKLIPSCRICWQPKHQNKRDLNRTSNKCAPCCRTNSWNSVTNLLQKQSHSLVVHALFDAHKTTLTSHWNSFQDCGSCVWNKPKTEVWVWNWC